MEKIAILDFGSQYTQLIARRTRSLGVYTEILPGDSSASAIGEVKGVLLSGGPRSMDDGADFDKAILDSKTPLLGICYGMQLMNHFAGGQVKSLPQGEYGRQEVELDGGSPLFRGLDEGTCWMSHRDSISELAPEYSIVGRSADGIPTAIQHETRPYFGVQFHPEVTHTTHGTDILRNFVEICRCSGDWKLGDYIDEQLLKLVSEKYPEADFTLNMVRRAKEQNGFVGSSKRRVKITAPVEGKPTEFDITDEMAKACESPLPAIMETVTDLIASFDPEFQEGVRQNIIIAGGGSQLKGLDAFLASEMPDCKFTCIDDPLHAGADGALQLAPDIPDETPEKL